MAKRKRLSAANPAFAGLPPLETKSALASHAPIAGVAADAATTAALDEMAGALSAARREGRMIVELPLADIRLDYLVRDRIVEEDEAMQALITSLRERGQQVPVEVAELGPGRYGLISGWRRCQALKRLNRDCVKAIIRAPQEASEAYLSMVEENEIRVGLSYYERARIVVKAAEQGVFADERAALAALFHAGSKARRSKIGTFIHIVHALDGALRFPGALGERAGLQLGRALQSDPKLGRALSELLAREAPETPEAELDQLQAAMRKTGSKKAKSESKPAPDTVTPCAGVTVRTHPNGHLTLSGKKVDAALRSRLLDWLRAQG
ncbi:chromosome partitioning protein (plasmid) [Roseovarius faecimaris]|uniref:Chromosome partitioning protein n=1 Tax=Roseovarius faecimaris TaxID=2494550 RepID=A0A6I6ILX4_9RHOB|nr:ParB N-terminal domain-containing protein [Roseovarius faecimaris]QGX96783.1 chromosome partitioning protein [Roseovarius faecimaris]